MAGSLVDIPLFKAPPAALAPTLAAQLANGQLAGGALVENFERRLGDFLGNPRVLTTYDRSTALQLALRGHDIGPGDEVMVSPLVCLATSMPILACGARPVWVDVDPQTGMPTPDTCRARLSTRTKALILYHWAGDVGLVAELQAFASKHGLILIEDAAAAFGAEYRGARIGNTGSDYTVLSFYAVNQFSLGEGGALLSARTESLEKIRWLRRYGIHQPSFRLPTGDLNPASDIPKPGINAGLSNLHAALADAQFATFAARLARLRDNAAFFEHHLATLADITVLARDPAAVSGYWVYALRARRRPALLAKLHAARIGAQRLHLRNDRYSCFLPTDTAMPGVDCFDAENVCLPCGWWVDDPARQHILDVLRDGW